MALYLGRGQLGECMRSGKKVLASELIRDGRNPGLLVLPEWADPAHPQERPFIPDDVEGLADSPITPDNTPDAGLSLSGTYIAGGTFRLTWTQATLWGARAKNYTLRRSADGAAYTDISVNLVDYTNSTAHAANIGIQKDYGFNYYVNQTYTDVVPPPGSNASLLLHMDGANGGVVFTDSSLSAHTVTNSGNATTTTTDEKFGTGSCNFPDITTAANTYITTSITSGGDLDILSGTTDFCIEGWFRYTPTVSSMIILDYGNDNVSFGSNKGIKLLASSASGGTFLVQPTIPAWTGLGGTGAATVATDTGWHHWAITRASSVSRLFLDGVQQGGTAGNWTGYVFPATSFATFGWSPTVSGGLGAGKIDEVRVTKGNARYTSNFTPSAFPFNNVDSTVYTYQVAAVDNLGADLATSNVVTFNSATTAVTGNPAGGDASFSNVVLLQHGDGANDSIFFTDNSIYAHAMANSGANPKVVTKTAVFKFGTASIFAPVSANFMGIAASLGAEWSVVNTATDFTLECFFQQVAFSAAASPTLFVLGSSTTNHNIRLHLSSGGGFNYLRALGGPSSGNTYDTTALPKTPIVSGVWNFATLMRKTNVYYLFLNGTLLGSITPSGTALTAPTFATVASNGANTTIDQIYVDEVRFTVGTARYPIAGPVPVPTAAFPNY